jgi:hypothetical protein
MPDLAALRTTYGSDVEPPVVRRLLSDENHGG